MATVDTGAAVTAEAGAMAAEATTDMRVMPEVVMPTTVEALMPAAEVASTAADPAEAAHPTEAAGPTEAGNDSGN